MTGLADGFDPNADSTVDTIAVQSDGKVVAGGLFASIGGQPRNYLGRLDGSTGAADTFNPSPDFSIISVVVQADGKVLAAGAFTATNSNPLVRYKNDTPRAAESRRDAKRRVVDSCRLRPAIYACRL